MIKKLIKESFKYSIRSPTHIFYNSDTPFIENKSEITDAIRVKIKKNKNIKFY